MEGRCQVPGLQKLLMVDSRSMFSFSSRSLGASRVITVAFLEAQPEPDLFRGTDTSSQAPTKVPMKPPRSLLVCNIKIILSKMFTFALRGNGVISCCFISAPDLSRGWLAAGSALSVRHIGPVRPQEPGGEFEEIHWVAVKLLPKNKSNEGIVCNGYSECFQSLNGDSGSGQHRNPMPEGQHELCVARSMTQGRKYTPCIILARDPMNYHEKLSHP